MEVPVPCDDCGNIGFQVKHRKSVNGESGSFHISLVVDVNQTGHQLIRASPLNIYDLYV